MIAAFEHFAGLPRWVVWRNEIRNGRATKVPYSPHSGHAKADDPRTWGVRSEAEARARQLVNGEGGGIGIELGDLGDGTSLGGIDLDTCRGEDGTFETWAHEIIDRFASYTEISPSGTGAKIFFRYRNSRSAGNPRSDGRTAARPRVQARQQQGSPARNRAAPVQSVFHGHGTEARRRAGCHPHGADRLVALGATRSGARLSPVQAETAASGNRSGRDNSRSAKAFRIGIALVQTGATYEEMVDALLADPETADWVRTKGQANGERELRRIWEKASGETTDRDRSGVSLSDFYAYMPMHNYIYVPVRALWPAASVNARIPPIPLTDPHGNPVLDEDGKAVKLRASAWLDQFRPVEQMTWAPGLPISDTR